MTSPWSKPKPELSGRLPHAPTCPKCGKELDGYTALDPGTAPKPGDVSLCFYCGALLKFTETLQFREPDEIDGVLLRADPTINRMLRAFEFIRAGRAQKEEK